VLLILGEESGAKLARFSWKIPGGRYVKIEEGSVAEMMFCTQMTRIVLPQMLERKKGAIINLSSLTGAIPTPLLTVYSGSKVWVDCH